VPHQWVVNNTKGVGMEVVVDLSTGTLALRDRDDVKVFAVRAIPDSPGDGTENGALGALAAALSLRDAGTVAPEGDAFIAPGAVRALAEEAAASEGQALDPGWESGFAAMVEYAATKGWMGANGTIQAHIEWGN
jgi:hypothetical protein